MSSQEDRSLYSVIWRWHFYAGLFSIPFLLLLSATGAVYLFQNEIEGWLYHDYQVVRPSEVAPRKPSELVAVALNAYSGTSLLEFRPPASSSESALCIVGVEEGDQYAVYLNPFDGKVLGAVNQATRPMEIVKGLHSLAIFGRFTNGIVEAVAGWVLVLVVTGVCLWWPRGQFVLFRLRGRPAQRVFWRDVHVAAGIIGGSIVFFLATTGMPWSGVWGQAFTSAIRSIGQGMPDGVWANRPHSHAGHHTSEGAGWSQTNAAIPVSQVEANKHEPIGIDRAISALDAIGMARGYTLSMPWGADGVYTAMITPDVASGQRTVHIDQFSGEVLGDISFADYGSIAKAVEWGINIHTGRAFGTINKFVMLTGCLALQLLCISGAIMWWKRRPAAGLVAGRTGSSIVSKRVAVVMALFSICFPLTGVSLIAFLMLDKAISLLRMTKM